MKTTTRQAEQRKSVERRESAELQFLRAHDTSRYATGDDPLAQSITSHSFDLRSLPSHPPPREAYEGPPLKLGPTVWQMSGEINPHEVRRINPSYHAMSDAEVREKRRIN